MKVYYLLVSALCIWITPTHSQFFYSHYTPLTQISPFFPQNYLPALSPVAYTSTPPTSSVTYNIPATPSAEFRGFGYRTDYKDGASSTVFYVTGPEAETLRNFRNFPNFATRIQETAAGKARSLASDIIDNNAVPDAQGKIQSLLQPAEFQNIFDNIIPGVVNFYNFPAGTVPLALARQLSSGNVTTPPPAEEAGNGTTTSPPEEAVAAESVVNPKVVINDVDNIIKANPTNENNTEAAAENVTTEASDSVTVEAKEETKEEVTTASSEEVTTVESTTQA